MQEEAIAYIEYLSKLHEVSRPVMPKFNLGAYTDSEYVSLINSENIIYDKIDDFNVYLKYVKGE